MSYDDQGVPIYSKFALGLTVLCVLQVLVLLIPSFYEFLLYQRPLVLQGQAWRVLTTQWIHINAQHALVNVSVFILLYFLSLQVMPLAKFWQAVRWAMAGVALGLFFIWSEVFWYVGMSGFLHGVAIIIFVQMFATTPKVATVALLVLLGKLLYEIQYGASASMGFMVVTQSHLAGAVSGTLLVIFDQIKSRLRL